MDKQNTERAETNIISHSGVNGGLTRFNLFDEKQLAAAEVFLKKIIGSKKSGFKSIEDALSVFMRAQDLGLPFSTCLEHIHVINDKTGIDIHIVKALLLRAGVTWECTKDYTPQYQYTDGNSVYIETQIPSYCVKCRTAKEAADRTTDDVVGIYPVKWYRDLNGNVYNEFEINSKCVIALNQVQANNLVKEGKFPVIRIANQPVDYVTEYKFTRCIPINGKEREITAISHFSFNEAQTAELFKKDTYIKYARILIGHRAFTLGARDIAADVLMGVMEAGELKLVEDIDLSPQDVEVVEEVDN
jgi:hypothetical protein